MFSREKRLALIVYCNYGLSIVYAIGVAQHAFRVVSIGSVSYCLVI